MNERIKELAEQARKYAWENETHWSANAEREALFEQKFAELIILECSGHALDFNNNVQSLSDKAMRGNLARVSNYVKDRMGVAE